MHDWIKKVDIRHVAIEDLPALEWEGEYTDFRRVYADTYQRSINGLAVLWVADLVGIGIIGQAFVQFSCNNLELADGVTRAYMYAFRVRPAYRSLGIGSRIIFIIKEDLPARGFHILTLNVAKDDARARQLYERLGYTVVADERGIWSYPDHKGVWRKVEEPAWRMEKSLDL